MYRTSGSSACSPASLDALVPRLRELAVQGLARMYRPDDGLFAFRIRRTGDGLVTEGSSPRYTAIALLGLAGEPEAVQARVLGGLTARQVCGRLVRDIARLDTLGDVALTLWAASAAGYSDRQPLWEQLCNLRPDEETYPVVQVAWALAALCADVDAPVGSLRSRLAHRLIASLEPRSGMFPHMLGHHGGGLRGHVSCFADLVYPIHALARYAERFGDATARDVALRCAREVCARQGAAGQWWWHYDCRTGAPIERYPVYAVHQDAMAPMALLAVERAAGIDLASPIAKGLAWLGRAPELGGASLVDTAAGVIWRKVGRREPAKLARYVQAAASRLHPALRAPGLDTLFPAAAIDYEDRPYHPGWLLHVWSARSADRWAERALPT